MDTDARAEEQLELKYGGPVVSRGSMDVYAAAANMMAFSDYLVQAAKHVYGDGAEVKANVNGFRQGSFATLIDVFVGGVASVLSGYPDIGLLLKVIKESLTLFKHLQGKPPAAVQYNNNHTVTVTNVNGNVLVVNANSLNLTLSEKGGAAVDRFVNQALSQDGIDSVDISASGEPVSSVRKDEARYFAPINAERRLSETTVRQFLVIEKPSFKDGNKWMFFDGQSSVAMAIEDEVFNHQVDQGEAFSKGDVLEADVRIVQTKVMNSIRTERAIIHVERHIHRQGDQLLLIDD